MLEASGHERHHRRRIRFDFPDDMDLEVLGGDVKGSRSTTAFSLTRSRALSDRSRAGGRLPALLETRSGPTRRSSTATGLWSQLHYLGYIHRFYACLMREIGRRPVAPYLPAFAPRAWRGYLRTSAPGYDPAELEISPHVHAVLAKYSALTPPARPSGVRESRAARRGRRSGGVAPWFRSCPARFGCAGSRRGYRASGAEAGCR